MALFVVDNGNRHSLSELSLAKYAYLPAGAMYTNRIICLSSSLPRVSAVT